MRRQHVSFGASFDCLSRALAATASLGVLAAERLTATAAASSPKVIKCARVLGNGAPATEGRQEDSSQNHVDQLGEELPGGTSHDLLEKGVVTTDNTGSAPVGALRFELCVDSAGGNTNLEAPGTVFKLGRESSRHRTA